MKRTFLALSALALLLTVVAIDRSGIGPSPMCPWPDAPGCIPAR